MLKQKFQNWVYMCFNFDSGTINFVCCLFPNLNWETENLKSFQQKEGKYLFS